jgi:hypothetical protein
VWFVYAGFVVMMHGLMGKFYLSPLMKRLRRGRAVKSAPPGEASARAGGAEAKSNG